MKNKTTLENIRKVKAKIGGLYLCETIHGSIRLMRFGNHRKHNQDNWGPLTVIPTNIDWFGWRDHINGRFVRPEEILSYTEVQYESSI